MNHADFKKKLEYVIDRYSEKTAITYMTENSDNISFSFSDIYKTIIETQSVLQKCGVTCGDRVAIITPHSPFGVMAGLALAYSNITAVMIDASLPIEEICRLLEFSDVRALFTTNDLYDRISPELTQNIPCFELGRDNTVNKFISGSIETVSVPETVDKDTDVIAIIFSSGTTDKMKGIMVTYKSILYAHKYMLKYTNLDSRASFLDVLPFNHIAGYSSALSCFMTGTEIGFISNVSAQSLSNCFLCYNPTNFIMIPKVYEIIKNKINTSINKKIFPVKWYARNAIKLCGKIRQFTGIKLRFVTKPIWKLAFGKNIKICGCGTAPCSEDIVKFYLNLGIDFVNVYGSTETGFPITAANCNDKYPFVGAGNVNQFNDISVIINCPDSNGIGEIYVKTPLIMKGYFREPALTASSFDKNMYFKTGDCGFIDNKDNLHITGRLKEAILLKSGKKVSPTDVDNYYTSHLNSSVIASCGIETADGYDEIHMYVQNENYSEAAQKSIHDKLIAISNTAPQMYQLSEIHFIDKIPMTSVGKVKRFMLKSICSNTNTNHTTKNISVDKNGIINIFQKYCKDFVVTEQSNLKNDLGIDSLTMFEIVCDIEEKFNINIVDKLGSISTVEDLIKLTEYADNCIVPMAYNINNYPTVKTNKDMQRLHLFGKLSKRFYNFEVIGIEHIPLDKNFILCPNHESHFDGMWVWTAISSLVDFNKICCLAKQEHLEHWITRIGLAMIGGIPVDRSGNPVPAMERALQCLNNEKYNMLIHPEGTRTRTGKLGEFKQGAAKLSIGSGVKIIPVYIDGAYEIFPPNRKLPRLFDWKHFRKYTLKIQFGTPIDPNDKNAAKITEEIKQQIVDMKMEGIK